jgi:recombination protein RecT
MPNEVATAAADNKPPLVILRERLEARRPELRHALTDITPDQFIRAVTTSAQVNPDIQACTWQSVWLACLRACRDNLLPDGVEGAIVPYKTTATWIPMYQGLLRRFRRSGQFKAVLADCVRDGDTFRHFVDETGPHIYHEPSGNFEAPIVKVYALATTKEGGIFVTVLPIAEADKIKRMSRATRDDAPWKMWPEEMYKKTALRRLSKVLPSGRDIIGDDDDELPPLEAPSPAPARPVRAPGAGAALAQFASSPQSAPVDDTPADEGTGGEQDTADVNHSSNADRAPAAAPPEQLAAFERGQADKAAGRQRRALPGEYRDNTRLAICWHAGFDGSPFPEFTKEG